MNDKFKCQVRVLFNGKQLAMDKIISVFDIEDIIPPRFIQMNPVDLYEQQKIMERRKRFVDMIAGQFAHSLTEALYKAVK